MRIVHCHQNKILSVKAALECRSRFDLLKNLDQVNIAGVSEKLGAVVR